MARSLFRRILVPHDFSHEADQALRLAAQLAASGGGRLDVLHVLEPYYGPADLTYAAMVPPPESLVPEQRRDLEERVHKVLGPKGPKAAVSVVVGHPATEIVRAAEKADAIVMATMGRTGLGHLLIGSVAEKVVRHATVPVLTIRARPRRKAAKRRG
ncbi:MAG TPA: universal stress protein [Candidatus Limnocylindria bacterium]|nr:universal stress protein [Candidatus Limnocylindria bacterium]